MVIYNVCKFGFTQRCRCLLVFFLNFRKIEPTTHTNNWVMKNINKCHNRSTQTVETVMALIMFLQVPQTSSNLYYVNVSVTNIF